MMNSLEWLPIYFGILRTGAWVVPLNFRFAAETIQKCVATAEAKVIFFGEEFIDCVNAVQATPQVFLRQDSEKPHRQNRKAQTAAEIRRRRRELSGQVGKSPAGE